jgi:hypothetical protein
MKLVNGLKLKRGELHKHVGNSLKSSQKGVAILLAQMLDAIEQGLPAEQIEVLRQNAMIQSYRVIVYQETCKHMAEMWNSVGSHGTLEDIEEEPITPAPPQQTLWDKLKGWFA